MNEFGFLKRKKNTLSSFESGAQTLKRRSVAVIRFALRWKRRVQGIIIYFPIINGSPGLGYPRNMYLAFESFSGVFIFLIINQHFRIFSEIYAFYICLRAWNVKNWRKVQVNTNRGFEEKRKKRKEEERKKKKEKKREKKERKVCPWWQKGTREDSGVGEQR